MVVDDELLPYQMRDERWRDEMVDCERDDRFMIDKNKLRDLSHNLPSHLSSLSHLIIMSLIYHHHIIEEMRVEMRW